MGGNYTYIIASLPVLSPAWVPSEGSCKTTLEWISSQLDATDRKMMELVMDGFVPAKLDAGFYRTALASRNRFTREYFTADLAVRNAKVNYLNSELGRPAGTDTVDAGAGEYADQAAVDAIFRTEGLLEREKAIDNYLWAKAEQITLFDYFNMDRLLALTVELCIIERWLALDPETGRRMLASMTEKVRGTYGKIDFDNIK